MSPHPEQSAMNMFFLIAPCLYLVNIIASGLFAYKYKDSIYKKNLYTWIYYLLFGVSQGALNQFPDLDLHTKMFIWGFFVYFLEKSISNVITDLFKIEDNKNDKYLFLFGFALTAVLFKSTDHFNLAAVPIVLFSAWPIARLVPLLKSWNQNTFTKNGYLLCATAISIHILDYAYAADKPDLIFPGYLLALILTTGISCFSYAILIERAIMEVEIKDLLHNTARLAALGGMAAEIAHEINNPLTVLSLNTQTMKQKLSTGQYDPEFFAKKMDVAEKMTKRLIKIMEGLKAGYRATDYDSFKSVSLKEIFEDTRFLCEIRTSKVGINFRLDEVPEDIMIECRHVQITQTLQNLVYNAVDVLENCEEKWIHISYQIKNSQVEIAVSDSGPGIPGEIRNKIFDSLFTTKPNGKGTGMGLSISKRFAEEHSGYLVLSEQQIPTTFIIGLPLKQEILHLDEKTKKMAA
ncbi:MAG: sensor histidine kinase [Pseudobdellovibrio sp.]